MANERKIALLGQPNSGKSTVFNTLTGAHQHVGNWPGKTVEKVEGEFTRNGVKYLVADLPGTYSLSANSDEEIVTRDYIASGGAELTCILADASQLERSLFMLADYAGINTPAMLVLTMTDVSKAQGKSVDAEKLSQKLGIPVVSMVAPDKKSYGSFYQALEESMKAPKRLSANALTALYESGGQKAAYEKALSLVPADGIDQYSPAWLAAKLLEGDSVVAHKVSAVSDKEAVKAFLAGNPDGSLYTSDCKFAWIENILSGVVTKTKKDSQLLTRFDRAAISKRWGKAIAIGIVLLGIILSMVVAAPIMTVGGQIPTLLYPLVESIGLPAWLTSFINGTIVTALGWVFSMAGFVFGINLVFGLLEEVGYMARVSYVFDNTMNKLGLQLDDIAVLGHGQQGDAPVVRRIGRNRQQRQQHQARQQRGHQAFGNSHVMFPPLFFLYSKHLAGDKSCRKPAQGRGLLPPYPAGAFQQGQAPPPLVLRHGVAAVPHLPLQVHQVLRVLRGQGVLREARLTQQFMDGAQNVSAAHAAVRVLIPGRRLP